MTPSERVNLIKGISVKLGDKESGEIELTLKQFEFPTRKYFSGDPPAYIMEQLQEGNDSNILNLAKHLKIINDSVESNLNPTFWKDGCLKLFISHLASDKDNAQQLKEKLEQYAISGFVAHSDIQPTKEWQNEIELALETCDSLIALLIPEFHKSKWTDQEIGMALGRNILIIPIKNGQNPYGFIGKFQVWILRQCCRVGKYISAQASHRTGRERLHSSGSSYSVLLSESI